MSEERDRAVGAAWHAASHEEPPPALDAAIRAEARRAVGAGPDEARRRRWRQLRYPFAAAATVALLAFGIAQMIPPDEVVQGVVSDQPAPRERQRPAEKMASPPASDTVAPAPGQEPPVGAREKPQNAANEVQGKKESLRKESPERFAGAPPQTQSGSAARAQPEAAPPTAPAAKLTQNAPAPAESPAGTADSAARSVAEDAAKSEPFPARPGVAASVPSAEEPSRARTPPPAGPATETRRDTYAQAPQPPGTPATAVGQVRSRTSAAKISDLDELKAKDAGAESVEAWIARIRELKTNGQTDAAAKELAKFRSAFGERADALLPADLRALAPVRP
jgi:hypothetical protein